jgi:hypothetical protein
MLLAVALRSGQLTTLQWPYLNRHLLLRLCQCSLPNRPNQRLLRAQRISPNLCRL